MLPFSSFEFIYFMIGAIALVGVNKILLKSIVAFEHIILIISLSFLVFYPQPLHLILFTLYSYGLLYLSVDYFKSEKKLLMSILALAPMLLMKADFKPDWFQIVGLSYISFRTVQTIIDTNRPEQRISITNFLSFVLFTPTLLIGPIDRSSRFVEDLKNNNSFSGERFLEGIQDIIEGLLFKFILANLVNTYWLSLIEITSWVDHIPSAYAYTLYLYFDFAGYSLLAIGFGKMIGIDVPINFNKPYLAVNPADFWRRWHKSLGDWLKDYFFKPIYKELSSRQLFGSILIRQNFALFFTFFLMGCWNGFRFHFILSGAVFGLYSMVHNTYVYKCRKNKRDVVFGSMNPMVIKIISIFIMLNIVSLAVYIFSGRI